MSVADFSTYQARLAGARRIIWPKGQIVTSGNAGRLWSFWKTVPSTGVTPTTAVVCDSTTVGALGQVDGATTLRLARLGMQEVSIISGSTPASILVMDRLVHHAGLDGTVTTPQTTNLPSGSTPALTRQTSGVGVSIGLEVYTALGATPTTAVASYTNSAGVAGRTTPAVIFGGASHGLAVSRLVTLPLQSGDIGVKSVESVTLAASTGAVGNFGVTLYSVIDGCFVAPALRGRLAFDAVLSRGGYAPQIANGACIFFGTLSQASFTGANLFELSLFEE